MKNVIVAVKGRTLLNIAALLLSIVMLTVSLRIGGSAQVFYGKASRKIPIYKVATEEKKIALTFDAAWGADKTKSIVDILESYGYKGTFFLVGFWTQKFPDMVKYIDEHGFEIGTHSSTHPKMSTLSKDAIRNELSASSKLITDITGKAVKVFRPPFGDYSDPVIDTASELQLSTVQWSIDSLDWKELGKQPLIDRVIPKISAGDIILFHNNSKYILEALPAILDYIKEHNFQPVTVSDLIYTENYTIDSNGIQRKN